MRGMLSTACGNIRRSRKSINSGGHKPELKGYRLGIKKT